MKFKFGSISSKLPRSNLNLKQSEQFLNSNEHQNFPKLTRLNSNPKLNKQSGFS